MPELSVVIITYNEERNIERCLASIKDIADDIVVVDSFSTDKTEEICKQNNVRFIQHTFEGHIEQKNYAITQAKYPYILSIDADEVLTDKLKESIKAIKNNWDHDGYYINRLTNYCGKWIRHGGWYPDWKLRLWDSRKGKWTGVNPHDKYEMEGNASTSRIKGDLLHYSYYSISDHLKQIEKFTEIAAKASYEKGKRASYFKIFVNPFVKFIKDYFFRLGFLDGFYGLVIALNSAFATFTKYVKLKQINYNKK